MSIQKHLPHLLTEDVFVPRYFTAVSQLSLGFFTGTLSKINLVSSKPLPTSPISAVFAKRTDDKEIGAGERKEIMSTKTNLILDLTMFSAFLAVSNPHLMGVTIHEWLAVSLAGAVITHLLLHWNWIVKVGKEFFKRLWHQSRLNFMVNTLFFIAMTGTIFSGLLISESVLSTFSIHLDVNRSWKSIHTLMSDASVILLGVHFTLHLKWVGTNIVRNIVNPIRSLFQQRALPQVLTGQSLQVEKSK